MAAALRLHNTRMEGGGKGRCIQVRSAVSKASLSAIVKQRVKVKGDPGPASHPARPTHPASPAVASHRHHH